MGKSWWLLAAIALAVRLGGWADTVFLHGGQRVAGEVTYLGDEAVVITLSGGSTHLIPWQQIDRVEFSSTLPSAVVAPGEVEWNNALFTACLRLSALNPWRIAGVHLGMTWVGYALARYLEDRCGALRRGTLSCAVATVGVAKTLWELFQIPLRRRNLEREIARLRTLGAAQGYVFRGCYVFSD